VAEATLQEALVAEMLGDIGKLQDAVSLLNETINSAGDKILLTIVQLEGAGDKYNQAVLKANLRSKKDMQAYVETISTMNFSKTVDEQRELVQRLIREAVSNEITTLKKALYDSNKNNRTSFKDSWGFVVMICSLTALLGSLLTIELQKFIF
jgi:hypothetical protein